MSPAVIAGLAYEAFKIGSAMLSFVRKASENDEILEGIVAAAHAEGRQVGPEEVRAAIADMHAAGESLAAKLAAPPGG